MRLGRRRQAEGREEPRPDALAGAGHFALLTPEMERRLAGLRFPFPGPMDGRLTGVHRSAQPGASVEFSDRKEYCAGDDIRRLDWKAYARSDKFYVRQFAKDTHAEVYILLDCSGSMLYQSQFVPEEKLRYAARVVTMLAYLFLRQNDAVGLMTTAGQKVGTFLPARSHPSHLVLIQQELEAVLARPSSAAEGEGETSLSDALEHLIVRRVVRSGVVCVSDLFVVPGELFPRLAYLRAGGSFCWLVQVLDPAEYDLAGGASPRTFPFEGVMFLRSNESGHGVMMDSKPARRDYVAKFEAMQAGIRARCSELGVEHSACNTDDDPVEFLLKYLLERR